MKRKPWLFIIFPLVLCTMFFTSRSVTESEIKPTLVPKPVLETEEPVVAIAKGKDYEKTTLEAINLAGGLNDLVPGKTVFIKPNIVGPSPSGAGRITDWRVVQAIVTECNRLGAKKVYVGEGPVDCTWEEGFEIAGYNNIKGAELLNINVGQDDCYLLMPEHSLTGQPFYLPKVYMDADVVIDVPILKTHFNAGVTLGLKNMGIGMPPQEIYAPKGKGSKQKLHEFGIFKVIPDINSIRRPDLVVIDGMVGGEGNGPVWPEPVNSQLVIAGRDIVSVDTVGTLVMGYDPYEITYLVYAANAGLGIMDTSKIKVVGKSIADVQQDFLKPDPQGYPFKSTTIIRKASEPPVIDGDVDDLEWSEAWLNYIGARQVGQDEHWRATWDLSAKGRFMYDDKNMYISVKVGDDKYVPASYTDIQNPKGDGVEIMLSFDQPFENNVNGARNEIDPGLDYTFLIGKDGKVIDQDTGKPFAGAQSALKKTETGYAVEVKLPFSSLKRKGLEPREEIWVDFGVTDIDNAKKPDEATRGLWSNGLVTFKYSFPKFRGRAIVDPANAAPSPTEGVRVKPDPFIKKVNDLQVDPGQLSLYWLGQAGFVMKSNGKTVYIDPYLSDLCGAQDRIFPLPVEPDKVNNADIILSSHPHDDHYDRLSIPPMMASSPKATLILQEKVKELPLVQDSLNEESLNRVKTIKAGQTLELDGLKVTATPSAHEKLVDPQGKFEYLGYIMDFNGLVVYHTGDSLLYSNMVTKVKELLAGRDIDILMVPINGKWGNMSYQDAAKLAGALNPKVTIPMHYRTLAVNTVDVEPFVELMKKDHPDLKVQVMEPDTLFTYTKSQK